ncbi:tetratricopeptide repeat protein [Bosea sp. LjRoot90]|uniref:tetratricopeptide repeat protein n=1 Tax=Bosea sp. LjRoot90 TaxID=3342342 RepID=UPI003F50AEBD
MIGRGPQLWFALLIWLAAAAQAAAETVLVAPGISVTKRSYDAPINEMPFFGFRAKTADQLETDRAFVASIEAQVGRERGVQRGAQLAALALASGDFALAARRYNQIYLLKPEASEAYHGFAVIASSRFSDHAYAEELFALALRLKPNDEAILADYARHLLIQRQPGRALPMLEIVVRHPAATAVHWNNLGFAYVQTGQPAKACEALSTARSKSPPAALLNDLKVLARDAKC